MSRPDSRRISRALLGTGVLSLTGYLAASIRLRGLSTRVDVTAFLAVFAALFAIYFWVVWRVRASTQSRHRRFGWHVLVWSLFFRLAMLPAGLSPGPRLGNLRADLRSTEVTYQTFLLYDNDIWRYLWDGHVSNSGVNPYRFSPLQLAERAESGQARGSKLIEEELWQDVFENLSYQDFKTIYPPAAQFTFRLLNALAPASVLLFKFFLVCIDLGSCFLLMKILHRVNGRPGDVVVYAWNPLVIKEFAGSGHIDALMIFCLLLAALLMIKGDKAASLVALALSILVKISPVLLVGLFLRRVRWRFWILLPTTFIIGYLPFVGSLTESFASLAAFSRLWVFNPGLWLAFEWISHNLVGLAGRVGADGLSLCLTLTLVIVVTLRDEPSVNQLISGSFLILGGTVLLSATVMPWYVIWALPFASFNRSWCWIALTGLSLLSYLIYIDGIEHTYWLLIEYTTFFTVLGFDLWSNRLGIRNAATP